MGEFVEAYLDDEQYLEMIERLVNEHPNEACVPDSIKYSSLSRLWIVMMVGNIESLIDEWTKDGVLSKEIGSYFEKGSSLQRIDIEALKLRGIELDEEVFYDYLAIRHIRSAYVHGEWTEEAKRCVQERGFPESCTKLSKVHFDRFKECLYHIVDCLCFARRQSSAIENISAK